MESILISPKSKKEFELIRELLKQNAINSKILSEEEKEDLGLAMLMKDIEMNEFVSENEIISKLSN